MYFHWSGSWRECPEFDVVLKSQFHPERPLRMTTTDEFRLHAHELMLDLDAATTQMMSLISAHELSGPEWERITRWQHEAYERWMSYLNERSYFPSSNNDQPE
jgi:hypothetical protein